MSDNAIKPGGAIWKTGIHQVSLQGQPVRLSAPQYSLIQNYNLMKRKIRENGHIPIGVDHIPESVLASNPVLKKLLDEKDINPYDVGMIKDVSTDGESIRIEDAHFTNQSIQDLFNKGELSAWSVVEDIKASKCPTDKADVVADYFSDIERVDLVGRGGCETCLVEGGGVPYGYERINASFMEVDTLTEENRTDENEETNEEEQNNQEESTGSSENENSEETNETEEESKLTMADVKEEITNTIKAVIEPLVKGEMAKVEAKLTEISEDTESVKKDAVKAKVGSLIDGKIQAGFVTPAMKDGLLKAGLAMEEKDFLELLAGYKEKLWDGKMHANNSNPGKDKDFDYVKTCEKHGIKP